MVNVYGAITFYVKRDTEEKLFAKALEIDTDCNWGNEPPEGGKYTLAQALQVVWHAEPEWLHNNVLEGWTLDKAAEESHDLQRIWPQAAPT